MMDGKVIGCSARCKQKPDCGGCAWRAEYLVRQEWIRAYARSVGAGDRKFRYEHPDMVRRFLRLGPCVDCGLEGVCDMVCPAYARWWDLRWGGHSHSYGVRRDSPLREGAERRRV